MQQDNSVEYSSKDLHDDIENGRHCGTYGAGYAIYFALSEIKTKVDITQCQKRRSPYEFICPELKNLMLMPRTRKYWHNIATMDPWGLESTRPTIACSTALLDIPEFGLGSCHIERDGKIVLANGQIQTIKIAIDPVWNLAVLSSRFKVEESVLREALFKYTNDRTVLDKSLGSYLPPIEGTTVYLFGDVTKLSLSQTEIAVRVHDECSSSDTFGSDMCTCRPYLIYAIQGAVECAQRGGVGVVIYFRKEGRALGEVIKFRVYNARQSHLEEDTPDLYFKHTESIAGVRDARHQELMPDVILWLGIDRIDKLLSMSSEKYDAIIEAGIEVMQRVPLPEDQVPKGAMTEITAKIASGYASNAKATEAVEAEIMKLSRIRLVAEKMLQLAKADQTKYFSLHLDKIPLVADLVIQVTEENYPDWNIPYHSRWRHFERLSPTIISEMVALWPCDARERVKRLIDLVTISVLLDAGAGPSWKYVDEEGVELMHSEGLAQASIDMFKSGMFSSDPAVPHRVNTLAIRQLTMEDFKRALQHSRLNPLASIEARYQMLQRFAEAMSQSPQIYGREVVRPGNLVDWIYDQFLSNQPMQISMSTLFNVLVQSLSSIWPTNSPRIKKGDVWQYSGLLIPGESGSDFVPFHKITQWLCYSLCEPLEMLGIEMIELDALTALAEYRNGGLFIDLGVLELREPETANFCYDVGAGLVVEWRALTIALVDLLMVQVRERVNKNSTQLPIVKFIQGGTWAAGRRIAKIKREDGSPPISIRLNGITF